MHATPSHPSPQKSVWLDTSREPPLGAAAATGVHHTQVAIVGAGYTGLSTALHLRQQGIEATVLEAEQVGAGASGVNGGQVIPGLKKDPDQLEALFPGRGAAIVERFGHAADLVFSLIEQYAIDCSPVRNGWILAAHAPEAMRTVRQRQAQWTARHAHVDLLTQEDVTRLSGSRAYVGGLIDHRAGTLQPLAYARGLARAGCALGAHLFEHSRVDSLSRQADGWRLHGRGFEVRAEHLVIATDAYSGNLLPSLERSLINVSSLQIATAPIPDAFLDAYLPSLAGMSETRKLAVYLRRDPSGRLLIGGRGALREHTPMSLYQELHTRLSTIFPQARHLGIEYRWQGTVGLTIDELPHLHELEGRLLIGTGYNGRGVAAATTMGKILADRITGGELADILPVSGLTSIPWRFARLPLMAAAISYYRVRDRLGFGA